jgi:transposase
MSRKFKQADYETTANTPIRLGEALPANHLARFVVDVVAQLDLGPIYQRYKAVGGVAIAPSVLLSLLFYGYATGKFSSRKIEKATYEELGYLYVVG